MEFFHPFRLQFGSVLPQFLLWMFYSVGIASQREAFGMVQDPIEQGRGQHRVPHHLGPLSDLLVGGEDYRGLLIHVADQVEEAVGLFAPDRGETDLVDDHQVRLPDPLQPEAGGPVHLGGIHDLHQRSHPLETDRIARVDGLEAEADRQHGLADPRGTEEQDVHMGIDPVQVLELVELGGCYATFKFAGVELFQRPRVGREMGSGKVALPVLLVPCGQFLLDDQVQEVPVGELAFLRRIDQFGQYRNGMLETDAGEGCLGLGNRPLVHHTHSLVVSSTFRWKRSW